LCVLYSTPHMKNGCSVQNAQCGHTETVQGKIPDTCAQTAKLIFSEMGVIVSNYPKRCPRMWATLQHVYSF
jgi:hypothetical protein